MITSIFDNIYIDSVRNDLNEKELNWLNSRGGRNAGDVYFDEKGKYVFMNRGKVYIPVAPFL